jgi:dipeptide/tripeptide permease
MHLFAASASIIAPTLTGYLVSAYGYNSMFVAAGCVMAIGMLSMLMVRPGEFRRSRPASAVPSVYPADAGTAPARQ